MKRTLPFVLVFLIMLGLTACIGQEQANQVSCNAASPNSNETKPFETDTKPLSKNNEPDLSQIPVSSESTELSASVVRHDVAASELLPEQTTPFIDFGLQLLISSYADDNVLISPTSLLCALGMAANGASGHTRTQLEAFFGVPVDELNSYLYGWRSSLPQNNKFSSAGTLLSANSIWIREEFSVLDAFLQTNADYYGAQIYASPFDQSIVQEVNDWVSEHTDGIIEGLLSQAPAASQLLLFNASAFDAEWETRYQPSQVNDGVFFPEDGSSLAVTMLSSGENQYIETASARGFIKPYYGQRFAFAALLPNEGITLKEMMEDLSGETLMRALSNPETCKVSVKMPKFSLEYDTNVTSLLQSNGVTDAFDPSVADFSVLSPQEGLCISKVLHKSYIEVDEQGTRAGTVTVVDFPVSGGPTEEDHKTVILERPFLYMIVDMEVLLPIFIGTMAIPRN